MSKPIPEIRKYMTTTPHTVMDNGTVVGVFTTVDGMTALHELLRTRLAN